MMTEKNHCPKPPAYSYPAYGEIVNHIIPIKSCQEEKHARTQRNRDKYCVDFGKQLSAEKQK